MYSKRIITSIYYNPQSNIVTLGNYNLLAKETYNQISKNMIDTDKVPYINEYDKADYLFQLKNNKGTFIIHKYLGNFLSPYYLKKIGLKHDFRREDLSKI